MAEKLDIIDVLDRIDKGDREFFEDLTDDQVKGLSPYIIMRWMGSCKSPMQIQLVNEALNPYVFELGNQHTSLLYKLALCSSNKVPKRQAFIKTKKDRAMSRALKVVAEYCECSTRVASQYLDLLDVDDIVQMAEELGYQDDELKKVKQEYK